jgi:RNA polymerase sigma-70 factor (ECF subfamily)
VFAFALHLCGSREDAEDVVQAAYLHAFRALSAGEQLVNPRAWLMVVVRRQVYNLWRGRRETALAELPEATVEAPDGEAAAELRRVRMVLFSLPEAQHQAFVLRHWSGLSNREIAAVLDTSESAVETLLVRARGTILASGEGVEDACAGVRDRLAQAGAASQLDLAHIGRCKGCGRAQERLARITAAAAVVALVPRAHVAQALAAAVPGFKSGGVAAGLAAGKASAAKLVVAGVLSVDDRNHGPGGDACAAPSISTPGSRARAAAGCGGEAACGAGDAEHRRERAGNEGCDARAQRACATPRPVPHQ